jgi:hypothetical protein
MKYYEASRTIQAPATKVWEVLTDSSSYTEWDSGIVRVEGSASPGSTMKIYSSVSPNRAFPVKVTTPDPGKVMKWTGGMPIPGLFKGVRTFTLMESSGMTQFRMREEFTGLMLPLIWRSMPDLQPVFDQFANGLKAKSEAATAPS